MGGVELVEAVHDQERQVGVEGGVALQGQRGQPALALGVGPAIGHQPVLVGGVDGGQFGQAGGLVGDGGGEGFAVDAGAFQFLESHAQGADEAGFVAQGGVMAQAAFFAEAVHDGPQEPVLDGVVEAGGEPFDCACPERSRRAQGKGSGVGEDVGVEAMEGTSLDAQGSAGAGQAAAESGHLGKVGQDDPGRGEGGGGVQLADAGDGVGCLAEPGGGEEDFDHSGNSIPQPSDYARSGSISDLTPHPPCAILPLQSHTATAEVPRNPEARGTKGEAGQVRRCPATVRTRITGH